MKELTKGLGTPSGGSLSYFRLIDLSWPVSPGIPQWPGDPVVDVAVAATIEENGYYLRRFAMGEHSGTHLTAPSSFYADGAGPEDYLAEQLVVPAVIFNVAGRCEHDPDFSFAQVDLQAWEAKHDRVPEGSLALLYTGWSACWRQPAEYLGNDAEGRLHFPGFSLEAAQFLMEERRSAGLGTDTAGVEPGTNETFSVSKLVLAQPRIVLENLTNLEQLPATGSLLVIGLLRLVDGSGAPASVTAFVP